VSEKLSSAWVSLKVRGSCERLRDALYIVCIAPLKIENNNFK